MAVVSLVVAVLAFGPGFDWATENLLSGRRAGYSAGALALLGGVIFVLFNFRRPVAQSRRRGGAGLRLGQGKLEDRARFEARVFRLAGTLKGEAFAVGLWLLSLVAVFGISPALPMTAGLFALLFGATLAVSLDSALGGAGALLFLPAMLLTALALRRKPRANAVAYLTMRRVNRWNIAIRSLQQRPAEQPPGELREPDDAGPPDLSPAAMDERWRKARRFGDF